ncbi:uncharacterized protein [Leptinotarsa decemlineata]|uniref:uncharacterized protein n=1 Tax=Leptinotarsa decemlineata TaxID=7539 RepID=UPI003D30550B
MGISFIGNPCEPDDWGDSDIEIMGIDEWITIPNDVAVNPTFSSEEEDSLPEIDDTEDIDYNPDDENYELAQDIEDNIIDQVYGDDDDIDDYQDDYDDEEEIDYVTFSPPHSSNDFEPSELLGHSYMPDLIDSTTYDGDGDSDGDSD